MEKGKITIKEIAQKAGVSIATVSHVINRTRYVSPELVERVEQIISETGYDDRLAEKEKKLPVGRGSILAGVFPNLESAIYRDMIKYLNSNAEQHGYQFWVSISNDDGDREHQILANLMTLKSVRGIFIVPVSPEEKDYRLLLRSRIPCVSMERRIRGDQIYSVEYTDRLAIYNGTKYLVDTGHTNILLIREKNQKSSGDERTRGYYEALESGGIGQDRANILEAGLTDSEEESIRRIERAVDRLRPTAVIAGGNRLTYCLFQALKNAGIRYPEDISVIGFGDENWTDQVEPPITSLKRNTQQLSEQAMRLMLRQMGEDGQPEAGKHLYADVALAVKKSTRMLDNGPYGEAAVSPENITLSEEELKKIRKGNYRVAIAFHYTGTAWSELHEKGIRDQMNYYGIDVISVMDAHFDSDLQNAQLESLRIQKPDAVIAVPTDDAATMESFQKLSEVSKVIFLGSFPEKIGKNSYVSYVSVNEWENGTNTGRLLGDYFKNSRGKICVGMIIHGAAFYSTRARDQAAEEVLRNFYPNIEIVTIRNFSKIDNTYEVCREVMNSHPEIRALYVSWDRPALQAIRALKELGRSDVAVFTTDLDYEIAHQMEEGIVRGMSTQRPYDQGKAAALAAAKSFVSDRVPKYIGVQPYVVQPNEVKRAWKDIFHEDIPEELNRFT